MNAERARIGSTSVTNHRAMIKQSLQAASGPVAFRAAGCTSRCRPSRQRDCHLMGTPCTLFY